MEERSERNNQPGVILVNIKGENFTLTIAGCVRIVPFQLIGELIV